MDLEHTGSRYAARGIRTIANYREATATRCRPLRGAARYVGYHQLRWWDFTQSLPAAICYPATRVAVRRSVCSFDLPAFAALIVTIGFLERSSTNFAR